MKAIIRDLTALSNALATVRKVYAGAFVPSLSGRLSLVADDVGVILYATNLDLSVRVELQSSGVMAPGRVALEFDELEKVLKKAKSATSIIVEKVGGKVQMNLGKIEFAVDDLDLDYPIVEPPSLYRWTTMPKPFAAYLARAVDFRATDNTRPNINSVFIGRSNGSTQVVSTDGHRLYAAPLEIDLAVENGVLLAGRMAEIFAGVANRKDHARFNVELGISPDNEKFALRVGDYTMWGTTPSGNFPDFGQIINGMESKLADVELDLAELREAIETASIFANKIKFVGFNPVEGGLEITAANHDNGSGKSGKVQVQAEHDLMSGVVGFNYSYALEALDVFPKGGKVKLRVHREAGKERQLSPAIFASDVTPEFVVVMPMRN